MSKESTLARPNNFVERFWKSEFKDLRESKAGRELFELIKEGGGRKKMIKGRAVIDLGVTKVNNTAIHEEKTSQTLFVHSNLLEIHSRALACHSECLGMNAENSWAVCNDNAPPYTNKHYRDVMIKWGLVDEEGEPII